MEKQHEAAEQVEAASTAKAANDEGTSEAEQCLLRACAHIRDGKVRQKARFCEAAPASHSLAGLYTGPLSHTGEPWPLVAGPQGLCCSALRARPPLALLSEPRSPALWQ